MRPGQHQNNKRMRGRNNNNNGGNNNSGNMQNRGKGPNPLSRVHESNGPDVKIRGTVHHIIEKYMQLARDSQASGDRVTAENYYQHAEHYFRVLVAAQQQVSPHLLPTIRVDDQSYDDDMDDQEGVPRGLDGESGQQAAYPIAQMAHQGEERAPRPERMERNESQRYEGRNRYNGERAPYQQRPPQVAPERSEAADQPAAEFPPLRDEGHAQTERNAGERAAFDRGAERPPGERAPRPERYRREDQRHKEPRRDEVRRESVPVAEELTTSVEALPVGAAPSEGREPGLPSFLTRGRRRGRPAYRRADSEDGAVAEGENSAQVPTGEKTDIPPVE